MSQNILNSFSGRSRSRKILTTQPCRDHIKRQKTLRNKPWSRSLEKVTAGFLFFRTKCTPKRCQKRLREQFETLFVKLCLIHGLTTKIHLIDGIDEFYLVFWTLGHRFDTFLKAEKALNFKNSKSKGFRNHYKSNCNPPRVV